MKKRIAGLAVVACCVLTSAAYALYSVNTKGDWPKSWPQELEPLRKQSYTFVGPDVESHHYAIVFNNREQFEAAWPNLLKVKTKGAPIFLMHGPNYFLDALSDNKVQTGIVVHCPPASFANNPATPVGPTNSPNPRERWFNTTYIELVVDGEVVDLNRIPLPADTPIIDERFKDAK